MKRSVLLVGAAVLAVGTLTACHDDPVIVTPQAYGENGHCYYDDDLPGTAALLLASGACPAGWIPWPMPDYWHQRYYSYYSSPAFYTRYVPVSQRANYVSYSVHYNVVNNVAIAKQSSSAQWRGSDKKTYTGNSYAKSKGSFGGTWSQAGTTYTSPKKDSSSSSPSYRQPSTRSYSSRRKP